MAKFEVQIIGNPPPTLVSSAAAAYRWLEDHAAIGDPYVIYGWTADGKRVPVIKGEWGA